MPQCSTSWSRRAWHLSCCRALLRVYRKRKTSQRRNSSRQGLPASVPASPSFDVQLQNTAQPLYCIVQWMFSAHVTVSILHVHIHSCSLHLEGKERLSTLSMDKQQSERDCIHKPVDVCMHRYSCKLPEVHPHAPSPIIHHNAYTLLWRAGHPCRLKSHTASPPTPTHTPLLPTVQGAVI